MPSTSYFQSSSRCFILNQIGLLRSLPKPSTATSIITNRNHTFYTTSTVNTATITTTNKNTATTTISATTKPLLTNKDKPFFDTPEAFFTIQSKYMNMSPEQKKNYVPEQGDLTVKEFLEKIGRNCHEHADKIPSWKELFLMTTKQMDEAGIPVKKRKYIITWREWFKRGRTLSAVEVSQRKKKYLKFVEFVELERKIRQGLA